MKTNRHIVPVFGSNGQEIGSLWFRDGTRNYFRKKGSTTWILLGLYEKIYGHPYTNPCLEVQLPLPVEKITVTLTVKPKAYPMPLANPKSAWGKRMAEKLAQKS